MATTVVLLDDSLSMGRAVPNDVENQSFFMFAKRGILYLRNELMGDHHGNVLLFATFASAAAHSLYPEFEDL